MISQLKLNSRIFTTRRHLNLIITKPSVLYLDGANTLLNKKRQSGLWLQLRSILSHDMCVVKSREMWLIITRFLTRPQQLPSIARGPCVNCSKTGNITSEFVCSSILYCHAGLSFSLFFQQIIDSGSPCSDGYGHILFGRNCVKTGWVFSSSASD